MSTLWKGLNPGRKRKDDQDHDDNADDGDNDAGESYRNPKRAQGKARAIKQEGTRKQDEGELLAGVNREFLQPVDLFYIWCERR